MLNRFAEKPFAKSPFWLDQKAASRCAEELLESFDVRAAGINVPVGTLSGGNQQKIILSGKNIGEMSRNTEINMNILYGKNIWMPE